MARSLPPRPLVLRTRVYPFPRAKGPRRRLYYNAFLFRTREEMLKFQAAQHRLFPERVALRRRFEAICQFFWRPRTNCRGNVLFYEGFLGGGVVAHEMTHAALYVVAGRKGTGYTLTKTQDEQLATSVGLMCGHFWRAYWRWEKRYKM